MTPSPTSGTLLQKFQYGYDAMNRRTYVKRNNALGDVYGYDADDQLASVKFNCTNPDTTPTNPSETASYTYDSNGNCTQTVDSLSGTTSNTPNHDNEYTAAAGKGVSNGGAGNILSYNGCNYSYDANNRMTGYSDTYSNSITQAYDPLGRLCKRTINGTATIFFYDLGWRPLCDFNTAGTRINRYVNGPGTNEILTKTDATSHVYYYHTDGLGSVTKLTNSSGAVVEQYSYNAWGLTTIMNASGTVLSDSAYTNRFMYTGAEYVTLTGLYDMRNRFYSPMLARFLQPDPIGHSGDGYNIYRYCGNSPVNGTDIFGLYTFQLGLTYSYSSATRSYLAFAGLAFDSNGNINTYWGGGAGQQIGIVPGESLAIASASSNAVNNWDLGGEFLNQSASYSDEVGAGNDFFEGPSPDGLVSGSGISVTTGAGITSFLGSTYTGVSNTSISLSGVLAAMNAGAQRIASWFEPNQLDSAEDADSGGDFLVQYVGTGLGDFSNAPYAAGYDSEGYPIAAPATSYAPAGWTAGWEGGGASADDLEFLLRNVLR